MVFNACREESGADDEMQINESGLKIFSIEDLQSAAEKSVQFSKVVKMGESLCTLNIRKRWVANTCL